MSNLLIVFCIALFASATFGVPLDKDQPMSTEEAVKSICTRIIYKKLNDMIRKYVKDGLAHVPDGDSKAEKIGQFIGAGSEAVGQLFKRLYTKELVDDMELASIDPEAPVHCPKMVLIELSLIESKLLAEFDVI